MSPKKTKLSIHNKKKLQMIMIIAVPIALLGLFWFAINMTQKVGLEFSCMNGEFIKYHITKPPPLCGLCQQKCLGHMEVYLNDILLCNETHSSNGLSTPRSVVIPCKAIDKHIGETVKIEYYINSSFGYFQYSNMAIKIGSK